jgi:oligopeptidase B
MNFAFRFDLRFALLTCVFTLLAACAAPTKPPEPPAPQPPIAALHAFEVQSPSGVRVDNYYWLRDDTRTKPEMLDYLKAENVYYAAMTEHSKPLEDTIYNEIVGRIKQDDASVPAKYRHFYYYSRYVEGKEYPIHARKRGNLDAPEQILLDESELSTGHGYYHIAAQHISPSELLLGYADDDVGRRQYTIRFKDLSSGKNLTDEIKNTSASFTWADDNKTVFYVENDPITLLTTRVKKHVLGTDAAKDPVVYEERDHSFYMSVGRTGDDKFIDIDESSTLSSELRFIPANQPKAKFKVLAPREHDFEYQAEHIGTRWVVRTNANAKNFRIMQVDDARTGDRKNWRELIPTHDDVFIDHFALFRDYLVIGEHSDGLARIRVKPWSGGKDFFVKSDDADYTATIGDNREQDTNTLRYDFSSLITPNTVYDLDMKTGERVLKKRDPVLGGYDPANYAAERVWAVARDGTKVPVSLAYKKDFEKDGTAPLYQYAYGSYGANTDPYFSIPRISLLDRGFVFAIAHIRGGQEMGRSWYENGKLLHKKNTFTDFIDVTEYLVAQGYVAKDKTFGVGGSAGGLLMGAVLNLAPQDYRAIAAHVPFVDVVTTMLDESIPLTTNEFDEWGNPKETAFYEYMLSYSPYDNVKAQAYPSILVTTGLWDSQVQYYEPSKWVAKLRATKTDKNPLLFKVNMEAGHGGKSGRFQRYRETAEEYAFLIDQLPKAAAPSNKK